MAEIIREQLYRCVVCGWPSQYREEWSNGDVSWSKATGCNHNHNTPFSSETGYCSPAQVSLPKISAQQAFAVDADQPRLTTLD
jgi:hypothetical protein